MARPRRRLVASSVSPTKTAAGNFATGYRGGRFGRPLKAPGTVTVGRVGRFWGVFDINPAPNVTTLTIEQGIREGRLHFG